jgi:hypothetical protein
MKCRYKCRFSNEGLYVGIEIECFGVCKEMENELRCCVNCLKECMVECQISKCIKRMGKNDEKSN